jgi:hypothetical protein
MSTLSGEAMKAIFAGDKYKTSLWIIWIHRIKNKLRNENLSGPWAVWSAACGFSLALA